MTSFLDWDFGILGECEEGARRLGESQPPVGDQLEGGARLAAREQFGGHIAIGFQPLLADPGLLI
ncbi:hypothetical protein [Nocardia vinacea]|uniref:hypothetical protein n=1 Tax=Nocardia vinacea TaxID=96468 RepID=UPI002E0F3F39